jgi:aryl-alcohol dehydrogenase-like predicted oxidoreductase
MINGFATPEATQQLAEARSPLAYTNLGTTGLTVSQAGFGGYRIADGNPAHAQALTKALLKGINVIDTSANYADGASEELIGRVLADLTAARQIKREQVFIVSKVGYLQGQNFALSQQRQQEGRPFKELVPYAPELEHCIHPEFIEDQLTRTLERLGLTTIDGYLLHNPEYYLGWAKQDQKDLQKVRSEYYRRILSAFQHLETEVRKGRIRYYGISSNTFPVSSIDPQFTSLKIVWDLSTKLDPDHHFRLIQLPFNLLEPGAVLEANQSTGQSVLQLAAENGLGVLTNRPLNAVLHDNIMCLADVAVEQREDDNTILSKMKDVTNSETRLWRTILPALDSIPDGIKVRIKQQIGISDTLKHYWRNFGSYERWRQAKNEMMLPRVRGVMDFLQNHRDGTPDLATWMTAHTDTLDTAFKAVGSIYAEKAARQSQTVHQMVSAADPEWSAEGTLSQKAIRALRSTTGVSTVLVGMRRESYVDDVLVELRRPLEAQKRVASWSKLHEQAASVMND